MAIEDAYVLHEPIVVRAQPEAEWETLSATVADAGTNSPIATVALVQETNDWYSTELPPVTAGAYRVIVRGERDSSSPVTDVFAVVEEGTDVAVV